LDNTNLKSGCLTTSLDRLSARDVRTMFKKTSRIMIFRLRVV